MKQEIVSGSGISWAICKSAPNSRQITTPAPHHSVFNRLDTLPAAQPTVSKHWRQAKLWRQIQYTIFMSLKNWLWTSFNKLNLAHQKKNKKVIKILKTKTNTLRRNTLKLSISFTTESLWWEGIVKKVFTRNCEKSFLSHGVQTVHYMGTAWLLPDSLNNINLTLQIYKCHLKTFSFSLH